MQYTIYNKQAEGLVLVAIPALGERKEIYEQLATDLPHCKIISFDLPGHNGYQVADCTIVSYVKNIHNQLQRLGIQRAHFIGNSIGAWIVQAYYKQYAEHVASIWLLDGGYFFEPVAETEPIQLPMTERFEDITETVEALTETLADTTNRAFYQQYFTQNFVHQQHIWRHHAEEAAVNALAKELDNYDFRVETMHVPLFLCIAEESATDEITRQRIQAFEQQHQITATIITNGQHLLPLTNHKELADIIKNLCC
ncbi:alpha/beta fold hydrolase [Lysinibacillus piscis]|uniref:AB hydrolase-1 domain-containing protein n=1 Tax=Lysinibacillus piscis TaxID=2518931 RepID=A0ABQ5NMI3_9BACI|nr:alpha/beta hydrolase [Lysinibacillus sp. KH24]GLC89563.1 hypothetical protein LYSBPC_26900 [Lysinibacillus sp. KH24]